jgi:hypothetical protein
LSCFSRALAKDGGHYREDKLDRFGGCDGGVRGVILFYGGE